MRETSGIETPCVNICVMHPGHGICLGCGRTPAEIGAWLSLAPDQRRNIMAGLKLRLDGLGRRKRKPLQADAAQAEVAEEA